MATTTATTTAPSGSALRNPKDSMKSTWRGDKKQWGYHHWMIELLGMHHIDEAKPAPPKFAKTDSIPYLPPFDNHKWVLAHACWPLVLHQIINWTIAPMSGFAAFVFYAVAYKLNGIHELQTLRRLGEKYGFLDGDKHERDGIPDHAVDKVFISLVLTSTLRPMMSLFLAWDGSKSPINGFTWWILLEIGLYSIILDFWFYWYHRCMHHFEDLWKYHRTHHLTKHPNPLLTLYADEEQEIFDIVVIPFLTWGTMRLMGLPMGFYEWWICHQYIVYTELWGHSGIRIFSTPPQTLSWFLALFDAELAIEDHDLHHRKGWKKSHNYGKQTRLWDRLFNTCHERYESLPENIDYDHPIGLPIFS